MFGIHTRTGGCATAIAGVYWTGPPLLDGEELLADWGSRLRRQLSRAEAQALAEEVQVTLPGPALQGRHLQEAAKKLLRKARKVNHSFRMSRLSSSATLTTRSGKC